MVKYINKEDALFVKKFNKKNLGISDNNEKLIKWQFLSVFVISTLVGLLPIIFHYLKLDFLSIILVMTAIPIAHGIGYNRGIDIVHKEMNRSKIQ